LALSKIAATANDSLIDLAHRAYHTFQTFQPDLALLDHPVTNLIHHEAFQWVSTSLKLELKEERQGIYIKHFHLYGMDYVVYQGTRGTETSNAVIKALYHWMEKKTRVILDITWAELTIEELALLMSSKKLFGLKFEGDITTGTPSSKEQFEKLLSSHPMISFLALHVPNYPEWIPVLANGLLGNNTLI
jgi:hypothetical protein